MLLIAHRGGIALRVENTLAAFANAIELGADGAELDVHLTRDGEVVVHHDDALDPGYARAADGNWVDPARTPRLADLDYAALRRFELGRPRPGSDYARNHPHVIATPGERIPPLRDVIALAKARSQDFRLVIEIKTTIGAADSHAWQTLVDATLAVLRAEDFAARAVLCSFDWRALIAARQRCPALETWFTSMPLNWVAPDAPHAADDPPAPALLQRLRALHAGRHAPWFAGHDPAGLRDGYAEAIATAGGDAWFVYDRDATPGHVAAATAHGLKVATWGPNIRNHDDLARLERFGVAAACVDDPTLALRAAAP